MSINRYAARVDENQERIVTALRAVGALVWIIRKPVDLLVGFRNRWLPMEVKNPEQPASERKLTEAEAEAIGMAEMRGLPVVVVLTVDEALRAIGAVR